MQINGQPLAPLQPLRIFLGALTRCSRRQGAIEGVVMALRSGERAEVRFTSELTPVRRRDAKPGCPRAPWATQPPWRRASP